MLPHSIDAHNHGVLETNFPFNPVLQSNETITGSALLIDVSGDSKTDVLFLTDAGQIFAYSTSGNLIPGFPFSAGGQVSLSPIAYDIDYDDQLELFILNDNSTLFGWQLNSSFLENELWWYQSIYKSTGNHFVSKQLAATGLPVSDLMPANKAYVYPNPNIEKYTNIRYYLHDAANVNIK